MHFCYFLKKFLKIFSQISLTIVFFVKARENLTQGLEIILKIDQLMNFLLFSKEIFENFLKNFPNYCVFRPKSEKFFFEKSPKIIHFCNFLRKFFENFQNFLASGGLRRPGPLRARPPKMSPPPNRNPGGAPVFCVYI